VVGVSTLRFPLAIGSSHPMTGAFITACLKIVILIVFWATVEERWHSPVQGGSTGHDTPLKWGFFSLFVFFFGDRVVAVLGDLFRCLGPLLAGADLVFSKAAISIWKMSQS
jgi:hypothetical protein